MKRLFLLLAALFVVATLQAQVMCYEYECRIVNTQYPGSHIEGSIQTTPNGGKKVYLVIDKAQNKAHISNAKGEYVDFLGTKMMYLLQTREYRWVVGETSYTTPINFSKLKVEKKSSSGERYSEFYTFVRTMSASEKNSTLESAKRSHSVPVPQQVHENPTYRPRFLGDASENSFREWFKREMPAQDRFDRVRRVTFVIETDGSVTVEDIDTGIPRNEQLVQQVTEVLARSPKWTPAYDKDGKTPLRFRIKGRDLLLRRTIEGRKRDREKVVNRMNTLCERWGVDVGRVCCQISYADIGGITLEQLGERMNTATRPVVVVAVQETCQPSLNLMEDWNMILKGYEGKYDLYLVLGLQRSNTALREYSKAFRTAETNPSILFVYNKYGMSEERVGYSREKGVELISWFDRMMKKSAF